ncbi:MAG: OmpA family protein [Lewinellaceae bacterium]|nr:OmpA family protein [Lewinellaceae bacterium]
MKYFLIISFGALCTVSLQAQSIFDSLYTDHATEIYFEFGKSELSPAAIATLDSLVLVLRSGPKTRRIQIAAHTDSIGNPAANLFLSERRAAAVKKMLSEKGLSAAEIEIIGKGEREPIASNSTEEGRQRNRRATLAIVREVPMAQLQGKVKNPAGEGIPEALVFFRSKTRSDSTVTDQEGIYSVRLPKDTLVKIESVAPNYMFESVMFKVFGSPDLYKKYNLSPDIALAPARAGEKAVLRDLFFVGNQAVLLKVSEPELPKVLRFMQINPGIRIEVAGHINKPGSPRPKLQDWEMKLSEDRALMVYDYLLRNGIPASRIEHKGYGNAEMLFPLAGATEAQQQQNRRVEIRVIE